MKSYEANNKSEGQNLNDPEAGYEKAERDLLKAALQRSYTERFHVMMQLIKRGIMFKNAKIIPPENPSINTK